MRVKLSLMGDMCMPQPALLSCHDALPCLEAPTPIMWAPGVALQQNKLTKTVLHKHQFIALDGHDCGHCILHFGPPSLWPKLPAIIAFSKRKVLFSSSTVKAEDSQIACTQLSGGMLPMLSCGSPVSVPNSFPAFNDLHAVSVNVTLADQLAGVIGIVTSMMGEVVIKRAKWLGKALPRPLEDLLGAGNVPQFGLKTMVGLVTGAARVLLTGEGKFKIELLSDFVGVKAEYEFKRDGRRRLAVQTQHLTDEGSRQDEHAHTYDQNGNLVVDENSTSLANRNGVTIDGTSDTYGSDGTTRQNSHVSSRGHVSSLIGSKDGQTEVRTVNAVETVSSKGERVYSTNGFRGSSSRWGNWGGPL
jgi:hypothetical protein